MMDWNWNQKNLLKHRINKAKELGLEVYTQM